MGNRNRYESPCSMRAAYHFMAYTALASLLAACGNGGASGGARGACEEFCDLQEECSLVGVRDCSSNCEDVEIDRPPCEDALDDLINCLEDEVCDRDGDVGVLCVEEQQRATDRCDGDYHLVP